MKKREIIISLLFVMALLSFGLVFACPTGQIPNFDGSCIPDPNYHAGAVSCSDLIASSGKSAETLCNVNHAGQCCNQNAQSPDTTTPATTDSSTATGTTSDYNTYIPVDCLKDPDVTVGLCELNNQYFKIAYGSNGITEKLDRKGAQELYAAETQAETDYSNNVYKPKDDKITAIFDACEKAYLSSDGTATYTCYDPWKAAFDANNLAEANYKLDLITKLNQDLDALSPSGNNNNPPKTGITNPGSDNPDYNRGREDSSGKMTPSIGGYLGDAYIMRKDGTKVIPGHELYLKVDDSIISGQKSNINIVFSNAGSINLGPDTVMRVGNALLDQYYLAKGTFKSKIKLQKNQKFEIDTPNAGIFVRGTEYIVNYNETTSSTTIYLNEGILEINIKNKIMNLTAGNYLIIYPNGTIKTNPMNSENWNTLGNNFYNTPDSNGIFKGFMIAFFIIDLIVIVILAFWMRKKIKNPNKKDQSTGKGTASLVLGILGVILVFAPYIGIILSAVGCCLSRIQKANKSTKLATAGFVLGIIGLILNVILFIEVFAS